MSRMRCIGLDVHKDWIVVTVADAGRREVRYSRGRGMPTRTTPRTAISSVAKSAVRGIARVRMSLPPPAPFSVLRTSAV